MAGQKWNDTSPAGGSNSWLESSYRIMICWTEDGAMSLRPEWNCHHICGNGNSRPTAWTAWISWWKVRILCLSTSSTLSIWNLPNRPKRAPVRQDFLREWPPQPPSTSPRQSRHSPPQTPPKHTIQQWCWLVIGGYSVFINTGTPCNCPEDPLPWWRLAKSASSARCLASQFTSNTLLSRGFKVSIWVMLQQLLPKQRL